jgi:prefoldin subunit 5
MTKSNSNSSLPWYLVGFLILVFGGYLVFQYFDRPPSSDEKKEWLDKTRPKLEEMTNKYQTIIDTYEQELNDIKKEKEKFEEDKFSTDNFTEGDIVNDSIKATRIIDLNYDISMLEIDLMELNDKFSNIEKDDISSFKEFDELLKKLKERRKEK